MNKCPTCGNPSGFRKNRQEKIFCSRQCLAKDKKNGQMKKCENPNCVNEFYVSEAIKNKKYCSRSCKYACTPLQPQRRKGFEIECPVCKNKRYVCQSTFKLNKTGMKFCSYKCKAIAMKNGIVDFGFQKEKDDIISNPYPREQINGIRLKAHRRIMQEHLKRELIPSEIVHHINGDPKDNRLENLQLMNASQHGKIHKTKRNKTTS